ncbi:MAG: putative stage sporulation protein [Myxococcaceae bacterium]|nr:putative stage sporulation protein [Myxococcaceae bacterium]
MPDFTADVRARLRREEEAELAIDVDLEAFDEQTERRLAPTVRPGRLKSMSFRTEDVVAYVNSILPHEPAVTPPLTSSGERPIREREPTTTDLIDLLFDAMQDLPLFETSTEAGCYCLASVLKVLPARAGLVHLYDVDTREFVVVYAQGPRAERLLLTRQPESDSLLGSAMYKHRVVTVTYEENGGTPLERYAVFGRIVRAVVAPVLDGGRFLGALELIDPTLGADFDDRAENALMYVADRYAELLAERGVTLGKVVAPPSGAMCRLCDEGDVDHDHDQAWDDGVTLKAAR